MKNKLNDYSNATASLLAARGRRASWGKFAAAAGSALAMTTAADANIIYRGPQNITAHQGHQSLSINGLKLFIGASARSYGYNYTYSGNKFSYFNKAGKAFIVGAGAKVLANGSYALRRLFSGNRISAGVGPFNSVGWLKIRSSSGSQFAGHKRLNSFTLGSWIAGKTAFAGLEVGPGEFGWIRLRFDDNAKGLPDSITAIDWAYNTSGPINAGQTTGSTPEPGSLSLLALAAGATGILALRRKRAQQ